MRPDPSKVLKNSILILMVFSLAHPVFAEEKNLILQEDRALVDQDPGNAEKHSLMLKGEVPIQLPPGQELSSTLENQTNIHRKPMNLAELTRLALKQNPGLQAARMAIDISEQGILTAKGEQFGRIDLGVSDFTYGPIGLPRLGKSVVLDQRQTNSPPNREFNNNLFSFGGEITIPIYTGGRITNQIKLEKLGKELAGNRLAQTRDELIFNVASVYYNILKLKDFIRATRKSKEQLLESKRVVNLRFTAGKIAKVDTLKINTRLAAVEQLLIRFLNAEEVLYGLLSFYLGEYPGKSKILLLGDLRITSQQLMLKNSLLEVQDRALQSRPELLATQKELRMQEKKIHIRFSERLPNIEMRGQARGVTGDNSGLFSQVFAGIFLSVPLFDGGTIKAKVSQERLRYAKIQDELNQLKLKVNQEVHAAYLNAREAKERITAAQAAVDESTEVLRIEALKVRTGKSIIENLLDAQTAQLQSEQNFSAAVADYQIQLMALKKAIGMIEVEG